MVTSACVAWGAAGCGRVSACRMDLRVDGRAEARNREKPGEVGQLAGRHERQQDRGHRGQGRAGIPPRKKSRFHLKKNASLR